METSTPSSSSSSSSSSSRVGLLTVHIYSALKFHPIDAADGELYILCSLDGEQEQRTHTVYQSASPIFHSSLSFSVPHFRSLLVMHLVDARTDKRIGRAAMSLYAVSVRQSQTMSEELLYDGKNNPMGVLNLKIAFKEDISALFLATHPRAIAPSPPEALSVERLRDHVNRITALVRLVGQMGVEYRRITQWEEPLLSTTVLLLFVYACLRLNSEYFLCVPLFLLLYLMVSAYLRRADGSFQKQYIEMDSGIASSEDSKASSSLASSSFHHRAIAVLRIAVCGFRNFSSSQTPGLITIAYLPSAAAVAKPSALDDKSSTGKTSSSSGKIGSSSSEEYVIATQQPQARGRSHETTSTAASIVGGITHLLSNTIGSIGSRSESKRDTALQNNCDLWGNDISYLYPLLQPLDLNPEAERPYLPWSQSPGVIKITVRTTNSFSLSSFMEKEPSIGTVKLPISSLVEDEGKKKQASGSLQREVDVWLPVQWAGEEAPESSVDEVISGVVFSSKSAAAMAAGSSPSSSRCQSSRGEIRVRAQLDLQVRCVTGELSRTLQDVLTDPSSGGSTFSTLWNMRDNVQYVQNLLGGALDSIESFKNLFTWAVPDKTYVVFLALLLLWILTILIPGRYIILVAGCSEFLYIFLPQSKQSTFMTRFSNLLESIPNDDDLKQVYTAERSHFQANIQAARKAVLNDVLMRMVSDVLWRGSVCQKRSFDGDWEECYLVVTGRRLVWFSQEDDISEGVPCEGQLLLGVHAGTSEASPVEVRDLGEESSGGRLFSVFGRDERGLPLKRTLLCSSREERLTLQAIVDGVINKLSSG